MPKPIAKSATSTLVRLTDGRPYHWYDAATDTVYAMGQDWEPEGVPMDPRGPESTPIKDDVTNDTNVDTEEDDSDTNGAPPKGEQQCEQQGAES